MTTCKECGKPISKGRLEAMPGIRTCLECSEETPILATEPGVVDGADQSDILRIIGRTTPGER